MNTRIKVKYTYPFILIGVVVWNTASAQLLPLDSVLTRIENNNPALLAYSNRVNAADELVKGARALPAPKAGIMFDQNPYSLDFGSKMVDLSVSQAFPNAQMLNAKEDYFKSLSEIDLNAREQLKNQLFAQAKLRYFSLYIAQRKTSVIKENIRLMQNMIEIASKQLASGMGSLSSVFKMKARLADSQTMLIEEENMTKAGIAELNYLMANGLKQNFQIDTVNPTKEYRTQNLLPSKDVLETNRSDIQKMNSEINSMKLNQTVMGAMLKPDFELKARHYINSGQPNFYAVEAMVMIPIAPWSAKGYKSQVKSMDFQIASMEQEKQAMINMASNMVNMTVITLNAEHLKMDNYTQNIIPAYKKSFDASLMSYSQNTADIMNVILAWDDLQMAQMQYLERMDTLLKAQVEYEREMQIR